MPLPIRRILVRSEPRQNLSSSKFPPKEPVTPKSIRSKKTERKWHVKWAEVIDLYDKRWYRPMRASRQTGMRGSMPENSTGSWKKLNSDVRRRDMKTLLLIFLLGSLPLHAQRVDSLEGLWQGYDGEWGHVSRQLVALAETIPAEKFTWRPAPGVRSTSEVFMHIALANFYLLSVTGPEMPADLTSANMEKTVTQKVEVISWLKRSLDAVKNAHAGLTSTELQRRVKIEGRDATVEGIYLRILVHANEHMGQLVAYGRMNGIVPPWSEGSKK